MNESLYIKGINVGRISIKERIVLNMPRQNINIYMEEIEKIRSLYAHRAEVAQENYVREQRENIEKHRYENELFNKLKKEIDLLESEMKGALQRQKMDACQALKEELVQAAINNGYEVEESINKEDQVQLQLVRREY